MPIYRNKVLGATQFTGLSAEDGHFRPKTGASNIQVRINSLTFHTSAACDFTLSQVDPDDSGNETLLFSDNGGDLLITNLLIPSEDLYSWALQFSTSGKTADGWLTIDYDFEATEGA